jgi:ribosomal protein L29
MTGKKLKELRELSIEELQKMKTESDKKMMQLRFKGRIEKLTNPMEKRTLQRTIAVINTLLTERANNKK